jgi:small-conductance mechanosensitive channel
MRLLPMIRYRHAFSAIALTICFGMNTLIVSRASAAPFPGTPPILSAPSSPAVAHAVSPTPASTASPAVATPLSATRVSVISFLGQIIAWYRVATGELAARDPSDILYAADNRQLADEALHLAFDYARAQAALLKATGGDHPQSAVAQSAGSGDDLAARRASAQTEVAGFADKVSGLQTRLRQSGKRTRDLVGRELAAAQGQLDLAQSHVDSINALIDYDAGSRAGDNTRTSLSAQIDQLEASLPRGDQAKTIASTPNAFPTVENVPPSAGFFARGEVLMSLQREQQAIDDALRMTAEIDSAATAQRDHLAQSLREIDDQSVVEAHEASSSDIATVRETRDVFQQLTARRKLVSDATQPLARQIVTLNLYTANLQHWRTAIARRSRAEVFSLTLRIIALGLLLALVALGAMVWRKLTFRYVPDLHRRHQLMQLRRLAMAIVIVLIVVFGLGGDLRVLATVMGFAAAGIALALQNVILSFAGYFYLSGRFGIRVGDRVQLAGVTGDVLEIGLFKLTLMELTNDANGRQPTGRIVIFPNSIVYQPNGNFFNQLPGAHYLWNEMRLTLAPDCDYRLAEQRLMEVVGAVFARYRDSIQRDYHNIEGGLNISFESPRPFSRLQLGDAGIEVVVRYPVPLKSTAQAVDEISRRLIDAINREPGLRLVPQGNPALQRAAASATDEITSATGVASSTPPDPKAPPPAQENNSGITPAAAAVAGAAGIVAANAVATTPDSPAPPAADPSK